MNASFLSGLLVMELDFDLLGTLYVAWLNDFLSQLQLMEPLDSNLPCDCK
jgi:hypothetical protein